MVNSRKPDSCQSEYELVIDKINIEVGSNYSFKRNSINSQTFRETKDESTDSEDISGKRISQEEKCKSKADVFPNEESVYSGESFCSDDTSESESEMTDVTPRSLLSLSSSLAYNGIERSGSAFGEKFEDSDDEMYGLTHNMRYLSMDSLRQMSSGHQQFSSKRKNMTFTNEELMKIERDNQILLRRIMGYQRPHNKITKTQNVQKRLSSSAINRRKLQRKIEQENMMLLQKIQKVKPCVLPWTKSASCRLSFP